MTQPLKRLATIIQCLWHYPVPLGTWGSQQFQLLDFSQYKYVSPCVSLIRTRFPAAPSKTESRQRSPSGSRFTRPGRPAEWSGTMSRGTGLGRRRPKLKNVKCPKYNNTFPVSDFLGPERAIKVKNNRAPKVREKPPATPNSPMKPKKHPTIFLNKEKNRTFIWMTEINPLNLHSVLRTLQKTNKNR